MSFDVFFNHPFLQRPEPPQSSSPGRNTQMKIFNKTCIKKKITAELPGSLGNMFVAPPHLQRTTTPVPIATSPSSHPESPIPGRVTVSSSPEDDFVLVPSNLPSDQSSESQADKQ